jgi:outer membrane protein assembly factor BamB
MACVVARRGTITGTFALLVQRMSAALPWSAEGPMARSSLLFIGIAGNVLALDRNTGAEVWRVNLKGGEFVNVALLDGALYATARGELFCLDPATGQVRWQNQLKGLGRGLVTIASSDGQQTVVMREKQQRDEAAAAAASASCT